MKRGSGNGNPFNYADVERLVKSVALRKLREGEKADYIIHSLEEAFNRGFHNAEMTHIHEDNDGTIFIQF